MVKVSITLPNKAQITFESEEPEVIHEVVGMVLRDLPRDLMLSALPPNPLSNSPSNGSSDHPETREQDVPEKGIAGKGSNVDDGVEHAPIEDGPPEIRLESPGPVAPPRSEPASSIGAEPAFVEFCRSANPLGDMRRVVVAAEGASRFLGTPSVDQETLGRLFDLIGWPRPHSFVQTLRNAARSKFRWLERIPGRAGHYTVTNVGRSTAFS